MAKSSQASGHGKAPAEVVKLEAALTISHATILRELLLKQLEKTPELGINASLVERITTPCVQLLLSAERSAANAGGRIRLEAPSPAFSEAFSALGLSSTLKNWSA